MNGYFTLVTVTGAHLQEKPEESPTRKDKGPVGLGLNYEWDGEFVLKEGREVSSLTLEEACRALAETWSLLYRSGFHAALYSANFSKSGRSLVFQLSQRIAILDPEGYVKRSKPTHNLPAHRLLRESEEYVPQSIKLAEARELANYYHPETKEERIRITAAIAQAAQNLIVRGKEEAEPPSDEEVLGESKAQLTLDQKFGTGGLAAFTSAP